MTKGTGKKKGTGKRKDTGRRRSRERDRNTCKDNYRMTGKGNPDKCSMDRNRSSPSISSTGKHKLRGGSQAQHSM